MSTLRFKFLLPDIFINVSDEARGINITGQMTGKVNFEFIALDVLTDGLEIDIMTAVLLTLRLQTTYVNTLYSYQCIIIVSYCDKTQTWRLYKI